MAKYGYTLTLAAPDGALHPRVIEIQADKHGERTAYRILGFVLERGGKEVASGFAIRRSSPGSASCGRPRRIVAAGGPAAAAGHSPADRWPRSTTRRPGGSPRAIAGRPPASVP